jgi:hypothetical protein
MAPPTRRKVECGHRAGKAVNAADQIEACFTPRRSPPPPRHSPATLQWAEQVCAASAPPPWAPACGWTRRGQRANAIQFVSVQRGAACLMVAMARVRMRMRMRMGSPTPADGISRARRGAYSPAAPLQRARLARVYVRVCMFVWAPLLCVSCPGLSWGESPGGARRGAYGSHLELLSSASGSGPLQDHVLHHNVLVVKVL